MSQKLDLSKLSAAQIAGLIELGVLDAPSIVTEASFTPSDAHVEAYKGWIEPPEAYVLLHPIAKKGRCTAKAVLNSLPVTGTVSVRALKKGWRGAFNRSGVTATESVKNGKLVRSVYSQRTNVDGETMDGRAPAFFKAGGKLVVDERAKTASLRLPSGFKFSAEQVIALEEAIG